MSAAERCELNPPWPRHVVGSSAEGHRTDIAAARSHQRHTRCTCRARGQGNTRCKQAKRFAARQALRYVNIYWPLLIRMEPPPRAIDDLQIFNRWCFDMRSISTESIGESSVVKDSARCALRRLSCFFREVQPNEYCSFA